MLNINPDGTSLFFVSFFFFFSFSFFPLTLFRVTGKNKKGKKKNMNQNNFKEARPEKHDKNNKRHGQKKGRGRRKKTEQLT